MTRNWREGEKPVIDLSSFTVSKIYFFQVIIHYCIFNTIILEFEACLASRTVGGTVASWLVRLTPERAVRIRALAWDIVLCSWARHFTLTEPLSAQVYNWVPANCWGNLAKLRGSDLRWTSIPSRGSRKYF